MENLNFSAVFWGMTIILILFLFFGCSSAPTVAAKPEAPPVATAPVDTRPPVSAEDRDVLIFPEEKDEALVIPIVNGGMSEAATELLTALMDLVAKKCGRIDKDLVEAFARRVGNELQGVIFLPRSACTKRTGATTSGSNPFEVPEWGDIKTP